MKMKMNWKKGLVIVPLSTAFLLGGMAPQPLAHEHAAAETAAPAAELRTSLDHLLSEHAFLAVEVMRKGAEGAEDFEASAAALNANTEDLSAAIASVYGDEAGAQFKKMWSSHIGFFVDYVNASVKGDEAAKKKALDQLSQYRKDFSQFLETATDKRLEAGALAEGLQMHVNQLVKAFDHYMAGDYETAYEQEREAIHHMYMVSKGLSNAIAQQFPEKFNDTTAVSPADDLRSSLNYLLTEHAGLAAMAMQNGIDGSKDFQASADALADNTEDLSAAIASVYGEEAGMQFKEMWAEHIGHFVSYVKGTGAKDEAAKQAALEELSQYKTEFAKFLSTATGGRLKTDALAEGLQMHVDQLIGTFDSYTAKDYETSYASLRKAYAHMLQPAGGLAGAITDQFPDKFAGNMPSDMPKTGMGGTADDGMSAEAILLAGFAAALAITFVALRRLNSQEK